MHGDFTIQDSMAKERQMNSAFRRSARIGLVVAVSALMLTLVSPALPNHIALADSGPDQSSQSTTYTQTANVTQINIVLVYNAQNVDVTQLNLATLSQWIGPEPPVGGPIPAVSG